VKIWFASITQAKTADVNVNQSFSSLLKHFLQILLLTALRETPFTDNAHNTEV